jgi:hypothetical protein
MGYAWKKAAALDLVRLDKLAGGDPRLELLELHRCGNGEFTATPAPGSVFAPWFRDQLARNLMTQGEAARRLKRSRTTICHWAQGLVIPSSRDQGRVKRMFERLGQQLPPAGTVLRVDDTAMARKVATHRALEKLADDATGKEEDGRRRIGEVAEQLTD